MLLRRVIEHVKAQNWAAIAIDFVIVVLGIFVGLQVNNWNEARVLDRREQAALERLHDESERIVAYFRDQVGDFEQRNEWRTEALQRLVDRNWEGADRERMYQGLASISVAPSASPPRSVYDELISTGLFAEIGDAEARDAISRYYSELDYLGGQISYIRDVMNIRRAAGEFAGITTVFDPTAFRQRRRIYNFEALSADRAYVQFAIEGNTDQQWQTETWREALQAAEAMCAEVARISRRPCEPPTDENADP